MKLRPGPGATRQGMLKVSNPQHVEEAIFSRAFAGFAEARLAERMHEALVKEALGGGPPGHVSRDPAATGAREAPRPKPEGRPKRRRGRPRRGEEVKREPSRLKRQPGGMSLDEMLEDLPKACDHGAKRNAKGFLAAGEDASCISTRPTAAFR